MALPAFFQKASLKKHLSFFILYNVLGLLIALTWFFAYAQKTESTSDLASAVLPVAETSEAAPIYGESFPRLMPLSGLREESPLTPIPKRETSIGSQSNASRQTRSSPAAPAAKTGAPVRLKIPALGVNASVERVGLTADGKMGVPRNVMNVGWYQGGTRPGEFGSAVIDGHLDTTQGRPAVFYNLQKLRPGMEVIVVNDRNEQIRFRVTGTEVYDYREAPTDEIFAKGGDVARLNLITCDGAWLKQERSYDKRLVVFTEAVL